MFAGLLVFGLGFGTCDVSMNVAGAANERVLGRTVMPIFHAMYSIGTLTGAALGVLATILGVSVGVHLGVAAVILVIAVIPAVRLVPEGVGRASGAQPKLSTAERLAVWKDPRTLLIGLMVLGMGFAEGAAEDWLPLATVDGYGVSETVGAAMFGIFVVTMTVGRLFGVLLIDRFGRVATLRASALVAALGLTITIFGPSAVTAAVGIALWGLGTSLGLPGRHVRGRRRPADRRRPRQRGRHRRLRRVPVRAAGAGHARGARRSAALVRRGTGAGRSSPA